MRVITLGEPEFTNACKRLENLSSAFSPDLVVGIASGGSICAEKIFSSVAHTEICSRRPSSRLKGKLFGAIIRPLPRKIKDGLRIFESKWLEKKRSSVAPAVEIGSSCRKALSDATRILIIDDAIDSGRTMLAVVEAVSGENPDAKIATAVITVTTESPMVRPDYCLYNDRTLIRFPWSKDS